MSAISQTAFEYGPFLIRVTSHEWNCGDGCCSTSGKTAEIKEGESSWDYGDPECGEHYSEEEFAGIALTEYMKYRDLQIQCDRQDAVYIDREYIRAERNKFFATLAVVYNTLSDWLGDDCFGKSKRGKAAEEEALTLANQIYALAGSQQFFLTSYGKNLDELTQE